MDTSFPFNCEDFFICSGHVSHNSAACPHAGYLSENVMHQLCLYLEKDVPLGLFEHPNITVHSQENESVFCNKTLSVELSLHALSKNSISLCSVANLQNSETKFAGIRHHNSSDITGHIQNFSHIRLSCSLIKKIEALAVWKLDFQIEVLIRKQVIIQKQLCFLQNMFGIQH